MTTSDRTRAAALVQVGSFQAVVTVADFLPEGSEGVILVEPIGDPGQVLEEVVVMVERRRREDRERAGELVALGALEYDEYIEVVRFRATRAYLLGLMRLHRGSVTEASRSAGIVRESLHRLLRRHDLDAEAFREA